MVKKLGQGEFNKVSSRRGHTDFALHDGGNDTSPLAHI